MSRNRFRVKLDQQDEPGPSVKAPSDHTDVPPPTFASQLRTFTPKGQADWILRKQKVRAPHPRRGTPATSVVAKQGKARKEKRSSLTSSSEDVKEEESTAHRLRKNRQMMNTASLRAESTKIIPRMVKAGSRQPWTSTGADAILEDLRPHPHSLTIEEQNFVIKWLQFQGVASWSSNTTGAFCPCRDIAWRGIQMYPAGGLPWTLIICDMFLALSRRQPLPQRMHRRKAMAYKYIANLLADPETQASDEALLCVCLAMSADARSLSPEINRVHLKGLAQMISQRGVDSLFSAVCFMFHPMFSLAYFAMAELEATSFLDVQGASDRFLGTLDSMQSDGRRSQSDATQYRSDNGVSRGERVGATTTNRSRTPVSSSLWSAAMGKSTIHHAVEGALANLQRTTLSVQQDLSLFLNLYLLNLILWDLLERPDGAVLFLQRLSIHAENARVRLEITVWLLAKSWVDADEVSKRSDNGAKKEVFLTEAVIDALKIFSRITDQSKEKLIHVLSSWLFGCEGERGEDEAELESIEPAASKNGESSSPPTTKSMSSHIAEGTAGTSEPSASVQGKAASHGSSKKDMDPTLGSPPEPQQAQSAGVTSKAFEYLSSPDFQVMMDEAYSDWYEKNISKRPMPPIPLISTPPLQQHQRQSGNNTA
ncbi:hypothetical protein AYO21_04377 [Fonsecaea monophora]|uniref:Uncharacterized protein n=1 Tax=Fonsecaea monophora TaxID=254056 RepID=A0A177FB37_9EURO|nr:hypothetical protein AYO21_04377 [Fonsecaea monophora]KAH0848351.1 hypothetical protein FOPE_02239 [Fonsecaea pedrosoi]OAG41435.1 hypothetical protein AYO21_04377 [Fonsecaea monophora]